MSSLSSVSSMPRFSAPYSERPPGSPLHNSTLASQASSSEEPVFIWHTSDPEPDDALHDPSIPYTRNGKVVHDRFVLCSVRGWMNIGMLLLLAGALLMLFLGYPVFLQVRDHAFKRPTFETSSLVNSTGQVPDLKLWQLATLYLSWRRMVSFSGGTFFPARGNLLSTA